jgi:hypothetical protein
LGLSLIQDCTERPDFREELIKLRKSLSAVRGEGGLPRDAHAARALPALLLLFVATLGLLPHALFSRQLGELASFKAAYDEDTYALWTFGGGGPVFPSLLLSRLALRGLHELTGRSWELSMVLADVAFPALCALLAWALAGQVTRSPLFRLLLAVGLLFGQELVSLGCSAVWDPGGRWHISFLRTLVPPWGHRLLPDYSTSYLSLFRTPEPQVSQTVLFATVALLIALTRPEATERRSLRWAGLLLNAALAVVGLFQAVAILVIEGLTVLLLLLGGRGRRACVLGVLALSGLASVSLASLAYRSAAGDRDWATVVFPSRLPIVTPAVIGATLGLALVFLRRRRWETGAGRIEVAGACFGAVLVLTNQQIVSGWMISTRDWERYVDYPLLLLGLALLVRGPTGSGGASPHHRWAAGGALLLAAFLLVRAQLRVEGTFLAANQTSVAMKRALERIWDPTLQRARLVLSEPGLAPLLQFRAERRLDCLIDYTQTFVERIAPMSEVGGPWGLRSPFRDRLFEYFARTGLEPEEARRLLWASTLRTLAGTPGAQSGVFLGLLFNVRDFWHADTDDREGRQVEIRSLLPEIAAAYDMYLKRGARSWAEPTLLLTTQPPDQRARERLLRETTLAQATAGSGAGAVTVYVLRQAPAEDPLRP